MSVHLGARTIVKRDGNRLTVYEAQTGRELYSLTLTWTQEDEKHEDEDHA